jgi:multidrug efflux pump subunit AcrB
MTLSDFAIRRPIFTFMSLLAWLILGLYAWQQLPVEMWPAVNIPLVTVTSIDEGSSAEDVEQWVTFPLERGLQGLPGVKRIFSQTRDHVSVIALQFDLEQSLTKAIASVEQVIRRMQAQLPIGMRAPKVEAFDVAQLPVMTLVATDSEANNKASFAADASMPWENFLEDEVKPRLLNIAGVSEVRLQGASDYALNVRLHANRLKPYRLSPLQVIQWLTANAQDIPSGSLKMAGRVYGVRLQSRFASYAELAAFPILTLPTGDSVTLAQIAEIKKEWQPESTMVRINGKPAIALEIIKDKHASATAVVDDIRTQLPKWQKEWETKLKVEPLLDQARDIEANAHEVEQALYFGGFMAIVIIYLFLLDLRGTIISALAIPLSVLGAVWGIYLLGFSLNQITLLSLSLAIGLLIDDAVIVRESITRRLDLGDDPQTAARRGTRDITLAVLATTFTLVAVFAPVALMKGIVAQFFRQFGLTMSIAVLVSLWIALTVDPMLSAYWVRPQQRGEHAPGGFHKSWVSFGKICSSLYQRSLLWALQHSTWVVVITVAILWLSLRGVPHMGVEFLGSQDRGQLLLSVDYALGSDTETTVRLHQPLETALMQMSDIAQVFSQMGARQNPQHVEMRLVLQPVAKRQEKNLGLLKEQIRQHISRQNIEHMQWTLSEPLLMEGVGDWPPIAISVMGDDVEKIKDYTQFLTRILKNIPGTKDVIAEEWHWRQGFHVQPDRHRAAQLHMPTALLGQQLRQNIAGVEVARLKDGHHVWPVRVGLHIQDNIDDHALERLDIYGEAFGQQPLSNFARVEKQEQLQMIAHEQGKRQLAITSQIAWGYSLGRVVETLEAELKQTPPPEGIGLHFYGQKQDLDEMLSGIQKALGLALLLTFLILALQFESLLHPFTIMLAIPLALLGSLFVLQIAGQPLALGTGIGFILTMGLVTKNSILLVDAGLCEQKQSQAPAQEAMLKAAPRRLRPILMTSSAMILGMLPTALSTGLGAEFRAPMALCVIGGVFSSTFFTLWVVPVVFVWVEQLKHWGRKIWTIASNNGSKS